MVLMLKLPMLVSVRAKSWSERVMGVADVHSLCTD